MAVADDEDELDSGVDPGFGRSGEVVEASSVKWNNQDQQ